jgi:hypothetical protein
MNKDQSLTWELLTILGVILLLISPLGQWLAGVVYEASVHHDMNLSFNPFGGSKTSTFQPTSSSSSGGSRSGSSGTSLFNVGIIDANGEAGTMQVVAHDQASALGNATQGGNTPTGIVSFV